MRKGIPEEWRTSTITPIYMGASTHLREHLHIQLLRYITYALNHCNPIVGLKKFSNIALRCALSPMGANIALLH